MREVTPNEGRTDERTPQLLQRSGFEIREVHMTTMPRQLRSGLGDFHVDEGGQSPAAPLRPGRG